MKRRHLNDLPPEVIKFILTNLSIASLLSFSRTSRYNHALAIDALETLELAVFSKKIHCMLAFLESHCQSDENEDDGSLTESKPAAKVNGSSLLAQIAPTDSADSTRELYQIALTTPPNPWIAGYHYPIIALPANLTGHRIDLSRSPPSPPPGFALRGHYMTSQNNVAAKVLSSSSMINLRSLTFHAYSLHTQQLACILATSLPNLHHLHLNFTHPYINDTSLLGNYWRDTPDNGSGSHIWNHFGGIGKKNLETLQLTRLRSLELRRAGITCVQLQRWIERNPELRNLTLEKARGVDLEFCEWLGKYVRDGHDRHTSFVDNNEGSDNITPPFKSRSKLEKITLHDCANLRMTTTKDFAWISNMTASAADPSSLSTSPSHPLYSQQSPNPASSVLKSLSLISCRSVNEPLFLRLAGHRPTTSSQPSTTPPNPISHNPDPTAEPFRQIPAGIMEDGQRRRRIRLPGSDQPAQSQPAENEEDKTQQTWRHSIGRITSPSGVVIT